MHTPTDIKVGYVLKRYPRFSETFIVTEILALEEAGQDIEIFALRSVEETHFQDMLGRVRAPVHRVPDSFRSPQTMWALMCQARDTLPNGWAALGQMQDAVGRDVMQAIIVALGCHKAGITHLHAHFGTVSTSVARLAALLAGITYSFTAHAKDIYCDYDEPVGLDVKLRDAATAITVSDYNVQHLRDTFGADASKLERVYNGIALERFSYSPPVPAGGEILAVGRLVEKKGFDVLIAAMGILREQGRDVTCRIIGAGELEQSLRTQIAAGFSDVVRLDGPRPQSEIIAALRSAAMLACPCIVGVDGNRDGLPTVLLEAMAIGTPCVATDVTGIPELVRDGETGLCVAQNDPQALATAMVRFLDDPDLGLAMSQAGRTLIEAEFDITRNARRLRDVFARAAAQSVDTRKVA